MAAHGYITGKAAYCFYATAHSHSYVVLVFHFLYRRLVIKGCANHFIGLASSQDAHQYSIVVYWKNSFLKGSPRLGIVVMSSTMIGCYSFMLYAAAAIVRLKNSGSLSTKTSDLTRQLMRALMYQTLLPLATAYSPPLVSVLVPFFGFHFPYIADLHPLFCGIHPIIDGCVLIYTIKQYRKLLISWFRCNRQTTTTTVPSSALVASNVSSHLA